MSTDSTMAQTSRPSRPFAGSLAWLLLLLVAALAVFWYAGLLTPRPRVALVTSGEGPYWDLVIAGAREAAEQYDVHLTVAKSPTDSAAQVERLRAILASGRYDGIAVSPINPLAESAVLAEVASRSTLITIDSDSPLSPRLCFVGTDNYHAGRLCGDQVRRALPDGGAVLVLLGNPDKENTQRRRQGLIDELLERPYEPSQPADAVEGTITGPKFRIVATLVDGSDPARATELVSAALKATPEIQCVVGLLGYSTPAILKALEQTGRLGQVKVVGFDQAEETLAGIAAGHVFASILQDQYGAGFQAVRILAENARGDHSGLPMFQRRTLPCEVITPENVAAIRTQLRGEPPPTTRPT
jgi:ribose transport system substrate-binding protein